ncbi:transposase [Candidatus Enterococcus moelleringii]|uniref:transposase n=1 Tax=Candidatus Enterococcus moelleringii TaxID=2815325 RepID=UPI001F614DCD|nr:transposase [Enterococcus sp. 669A]
MNKRLCQEVGVDEFCHSSLSRKAKELSQEVLMEIFTSLVQKVSNLKPSVKTTSLQIIDSTTIPLNKTWFPWAKFRKTKAGIKLHLNLCYLDKNNQYPESFTITNAIEPDHHQFELLVDKAETTYVVDRGYFDYKLLDRLHEDGYFFVTIIKSNTKIAILKQIEVAKTKTHDGRIISDQQVILGSGVNHVTERFRLVTLLTYLIKIELNLKMTLFQLKRSFHYLMFEPVEKWFERLRSD